MRILALAALLACSPTRPQVFGATRWTLGFPAIDQDLRGLAVGPAGPVVVGAHQTSGVLVPTESTIRIDQFAAPQGALLWTLVLDATDPDEVYMPHITADRENNVLVTGAFAGTVNFAGETMTSATSPGFVAKYDVNGHLQWVRQFSGCGKGIAVDSRMRVYVLDERPTVTAFDVDGTERWARKIDGDGSFSVAIAATSNDDIVAGTARGDETVTWLSPDGDVRWTSRLTSSNNISLAPDRDGHVIAADDSSLTLLDAFGFELWQSTSQLDQSFSSVTMRADHTIIAAGSTGLEAFSDEGHPLDAIDYGRPQSLDRASVGATADGNIAFAAVRPDIGPILALVE